MSKTTKRLCPRPHFETRAEGLKTYREESEERRNQSERRLRTPEFSSPVPQADVTRHRRSERPRATAIIHADADAGRYAMRSDMLDETI